MVAGCVAALRGKERPELEHQERPLHLPEHESSSYRFCTNFAVTGRELEAGSFVPRLEELGDSVLAGGDQQTLRVHVHTDVPGQALALFHVVGDVSRPDVSDMPAQA